MKAVRTPLRGVTELSLFYWSTDKSQPIPFF